MPRFILAKSDKDKIAAWKQDLIRVLHVFNVRLIHPLIHLRTQQPLQTELAIDTNIVVADTHVVVVDTQTVVTKIEKKVEDMHRDVLAGRGDPSGQNNSVCATCHPQTTDCLSLSRLKLGQ